MSSLLRPPSREKYHKTFLLRTQQNDQNKNRIQTASFAFAINTATASTNVIQYVNVSSVADRVVKRAVLKKNLITNFVNMFNGDDATQALQKIF